MSRISSRSRRCSTNGLGLEALEARQMLSVVADWANYNPRGYVVPENGSNEFVRLNDFNEQFVSVEQPEHGTLVVQESTGDYLTESGLFLFHRSFGSVGTYTPDPNFTGVDSFEVTVKGIDGETQTRTIWLNVTESVYAVPDWFQVAPESTSNLAVLGNDFELPKTHFWDESNSLSIVEANSESGSVSISDDGQTLVYTPGSNRTDTIRYTIRDSLGNLSSADVNVEITNDPQDGFLSRQHFHSETIAAALQRYAHQLGTFAFDAPFFVDACHDFDLRFVNLQGVVVDNFGFDASIFNAQSATNVQVAGVDEGDIIATDGDYLYIASDNRLAILDVRDAANPQLVNKLTFEQNIVDMYLHEDRLTIVADSIHDCFVPAINGQVDGFYVHILDVENPETAEQVSTTAVSGRYSHSRAIDGTLYTVSTTGIDQLVPQRVPVAGTDIAFYESAAELVQRGLEMGLEMPQVKASSGGASQSQDLFTWEDVVRVDTTPLQDFTSISTFDLNAADGLPIDVDTIAGSVSEVHVSTNSFYLFAHDWRDNETDVQKFDILSSGGGVEFAATGEFEGYLINQFAADENDGYLRLAVNQRGWQADVLVMQQQGDQLVSVGNLIDIAPDEQIYSARFDQNQLFVTTFRQIDPFFVIDLSDPTNPVVDGELKIPGFSTYLQVIDDQHVIGIGNADGRFSELTISLFDVSDAESPERVAQLGLGELTSSLSFSFAPKDHLKLTYVEESGILAIPVHARGVWGLETLQIDTQNQQIESLGMVEFDHPVLRSVAIAGKLYAIAEDQVQVTDLSDPATVQTTLSLEDTNVGTNNVMNLPHDSRRATDLNGDGTTTGIDVGMINNALIRQSASGSAADDMTEFDIDDNGAFAGRDVIMVLNKVIRNAEEANVAAPRAASSGSVSFPLTMNAISQVDSNGAWEAAVPDDGYESSTAARASIVDSIWAETPAG